MHLTVVQPFGEYAKGEKITDPKKIKAVLESENAGHVVKTAARDEPVSGVKH